MTTKVTRSSLIGEKVRLKISGPFGQCGCKQRNGTLCSCNCTWVPAVITAHDTDLDIVDLDIFGICQQLGAHLIRDFDPTKCADRFDEKACWLESEAS